MGRRVTSLSRMPNADCRACHGLGSIHMTRLFAAGQATPRLHAGARFGATCAANDRQIARMVVTLEQVSETGPTVNDPPMHNTRHFPAASGTTPSVFELVRAGGRDRDVTPVWEGSAELRLYDDALVVLPVRGDPEKVPYPFERKIWIGNVPPQPWIQAMSILPSPLKSPCRKRFSSPLTPVAKFET